VNARTVDDVLAELLRAQFQPKRAARLREELHGKIGALVNAATSALIFAAGVRALPVAAEVHADADQVRARLREALEGMGIR
jgi:hypothetical protein